MPVEELLPFAGAPASDQRSDAGEAYQPV